MITSNDPAVPVLPVPATLHVTGAPDLAVDPESFDFGVNFVGTPTLQNLVVSNMGTDDLNITAVTIDNPDFNFRDFNSNLVVRWEYQPGSLLYVVWSQARSMYLPGMGEFDVGTDINELFDVHPHNVFLVKFSKWFSM